MKNILKEYTKSRIVFSSQLEKQIEKSDRQMYFAAGMLIGCVLALLIIGVSYGLLKFHVL